MICLIIPLVHASHTVFSHPPTPAIFFPLLRLVPILSTSHLHLWLHDFTCMHTYTCAHTHTYTCACTHTFKARICVLRKNMWLLFFRVWVTYYNNLQSHHCPANFRISWVCCRCCFVCFFFFCLNKTPQCLYTTFSLPPCLLMGIYDIPLSVWGLEHQWIWIYKHHHITLNWLWSTEGGLSNLRRRFLKRYWRRTQATQWLNSSCRSEDFQNL